MPSRPNSQHQSINVHNNSTKLHADHLQIDHDLDDLVPRLPLWEAVQDLPCRADPTQGTCATTCTLYRFHPAT